MIFETSSIVRFATQMGCWGIGLIVFAEMGLFFCFFLPGDSLLFAAGLLASKGVFDVYALTVIVLLMSVLGYLVFDVCNLFRRYIMGRA